MFALPNRVPGRVGALALAGLAALTALSGCKVSTQLGEPCVLVRKARPEEAADGRRSMPITYAEIPSSDTDFISFGAVECDDLTCVLDADSPRGAAGDAAQGYCTEACVPDTSTCEVTDGDVRSDNPDLVARMTCRRLILDEQTLSTLRAEEPELYRSSFGENAGSAFCAGARR